MNLETFEALARTRRTCRHFQAAPLPEGLLERLLECARWAPSGYNLQPLHVVTVTDAAVKEQLFTACLRQQQIKEAPVTVVFVADRRPDETNFEETLQADAAAGALTPEYEAVLRKYVGLGFGRGPLGLVGWAKKIAAPFLRVAMPLPGLPVTESRLWATKQVMLAAMNFMLAAHAAGLATVPMEGFDEGRVKKLLGIPGPFTVPVVIPVGCAAPGELKKSRLPLARLWHRETW